MSRIVNANKSSKNLEVSEERESEKNIPKIDRENSMVPLNAGRGHADHRSGAKRERAS
jgi:hypothetical protein